MNIDLSRIKLNKRREIINYNECEEYIKKNNIQVNHRVYHKKYTNSKGVISTRECVKIYLPKKYDKLNSIGNIEVNINDIMIYAEPRFNKYGNVIESYIPTKYRDILELNDINSIENINKYNYNIEYKTKNGEIKKYEYTRYYLKNTPNKFKIKYLDKFIQEHRNEILKMSKINDRIDYVLNNINDEKNNNNFTYSRSCVYNHLL